MAGRTEYLVRHNSWRTDPEFDEVRRRAALDQLALIDRDSSYEDLADEVRNRTVARYLWGVSPDTVADPLIHYMYLVAKPRSNAIKIGTAQTYERVGEWERAGWHVIQVWTKQCPYEIPNRARQVMRSIESQVISYWRYDCRVGFGGYVEDYRGRAGMTESAPLSCVSIGSTQMLIELLLDVSEVF
jgi:hypothetical protein